MGYGGRGSFEDGVGSGNLSRGMGRVSILLILAILRVLTRVKRKKRKLDAAVFLSCLS